MWRTLALAALAGACGDSSGGSPMPPDAAGMDALCSVPPGESWIFRTFHVLPSGEIGDVGDATLDSANAALDTAIAEGEWLFAMHVTGWDAFPSANDPDVSLHIFELWDADMPWNTSNNFDGTGQFLVSLRSLDLSCNSTTEADRATLVDGVLTGWKDLWSFPLSTGLGALEFSDAVVVTQFAADYQSGTSRVDAFLSMCTLSAVAFPGDQSGNILDLLINDPTYRQNVTIDVDKDGDGFEQAVGDGVSVLHCIDGDGTIIEGSDCPCHPAIVDGFSVAIEGESVTAELVGVTSAL